MEYNKNYFSKTDDKKVLHKVRKQWVVVSSALLLAIGAGSILATKSAHASNVNNGIKPKLNHQINQNINQRTQISSSQTKPNDVVNQQARNLHQNILQNASVKKSTNQNNYVNDVNHNFKQNSNPNSQNVNTYIESINQDFQSQKPQKLQNNHQQVTQPKLTQKQKQSTAKIQPVAPKVGDTDPGNSIIHANVSNGRHWCGYGCYETDYSNGTKYYSDGTYDESERTWNDYSVTNLVFNNITFTGAGHKFSYLPNLKTVTFEGNINNDLTFIDNDFAGDTSLTTINGLPKFLNDPDIQDYDFVFKDCKKIKSLDLSSLNTRNIPGSGQRTYDPNFRGYNYSGNFSAFSGMSDLNTIKIGKDTIIYDDSGLSPYITSKHNSSDINNIINVTYRSNDPHRRAYPGVWRVISESHSGHWGSANWIMDNNGDLLILGNNGSGQITSNDNDAVSGNNNTLPWNDVKHIYTKSDVKAPNTSLSFTNLPNLKSIDLTGVDMSSLTDTINFSHNPELKMINLANRDLSHLQNMSDAFANNSSLAYVNLNNVNASSCKNAPGMFNNDDSLQALQVTNLNLSSLQNASDMFRSDSILKYADLSSIDAPNINNWDNVFLNDNDMVMIKLGNQMTLGPNSHLINSDDWVNPNEPNNHINMNDKPQAGTYYNGNDTVKGTINYKFGNQTVSSYKSDWIPYSFSRYQLPGAGNLQGYEIDPRITSANATNNTLPFNNNYFNINSADQGKTFNIYLDKVGQWGDATWDLTPSDFASSDTSSQFGESNFYLHDGKITEPILSGGYAGSIMNMPSLNPIANQIQSISTSNVTSPDDSRNLFGWMPKLRFVDLTGMSFFNTTDIGGLLGVDTNLVSANLSGITANNTTNINYLFYNDSHLQNINMSDFTAKRASDISETFTSDLLLSDLDLSSVETGRINNDINAFKNDHLLSRIGINGNLKLDSYANMPNPNAQSVNTPSLHINLEDNQPHPGTWNIDINTNLHLTNWLTGSDLGTDHVSGLKSKIISSDLNKRNYKLVNAGDNNSPFTGSQDYDSVEPNPQSNVINLNVIPKDYQNYGYWDTARYAIDNQNQLIVDDGTLNQSINQVNGLNQSLNKINKIDFDRNDVVANGSLGYLLGNGSGTDTWLPNLTSLDVKGLDTSHMTGLNSMFCNLPQLQTIDNLSHLDVSHVNSLGHIFYNDPKLTNLDLSNWNTANINCFDNMFNGDTHLSNINLGNQFNMNSKTTDSDMFTDVNKANDDQDSSPSVLTLGNNDKIDSGSGLTNHNNNWYDKDGTDDQTYYNGVNLTDNNVHPGTWLVNSNDTPVIDTIKYVYNDNGIQKEVPNITMPQIHGYLGQNYDVTKSNDTNLPSDYTLANPNNNFVLNGTTHPIKVNDNSVKVRFKFVNWLTGSDIQTPETNSIRLKINKSVSESTIKNIISNSPSIKDNYHIEDDGDDGRGIGLIHTPSRSKFDYLNDYLNSPSNTITKNTSTFNIPILPNSDTHYGYFGYARYAYNSDVKSVIHDPGNGTGPANYKLGALTVSGFTGQYDNNGKPIDGAQMAPCYDIYNENYYEFPYNYDSFLSLTKDLSFIDNVKAPRYCTFEKVSDLPNPDLQTPDGYYHVNWAPIAMDGNSLDNINLSGLNTSQTTNMSGMFSNLGISDVSDGTNISGHHNLHINFGNPSKTLFNTSNVKNMSEMFRENDNISDLELGSNFNTSNVENMSGMFRGLSNNNVKPSVINLGSSFNTSNVRNMSFMFSQCDVNHVYNFNRINTSNVTNMAYMLADMYLIKYLNLSLCDNFDTSKVSDMQGLFNNDSNLTSLNLGNKFDTSNVKNMKNMFYGEEKLHNLNLGNKFNTSNVTNMSGMFANSNFKSIGCSNKYNNYDVNLGSDFDTSNVTDMSSMFSDESLNYLSDINYINLGNKFNTSNVTNMSGMFASSNFKSIGFSNNDNVNLGPNFNTDSNPIIGISYYVEDAYTTGYDDAQYLGKQRNSRGIGMFANDPSLVHVDLSHLTNVRSPVGLFEGDITLRDINLSNLHINDASDKDNPYIYYDILIAPDSANSDLTSITLNSSDVFSKDNIQDPRDPLDNYENYLDAYRSDQSNGAKGAPNIEFPNASDFPNPDDNYYYPNFINGTWFQITPQGLRFLPSDSNQLKTGLHDGKAHPGTWFRDRGVNSVIYIDQHGHVIYPSHSVSNNGGTKMKYKYHNQEVTAGNNRTDFDIWLKRQSLPNGFHMSNQAPKVYTKNDENKSEVDYIAVVQVIGDNSYGTQKTLAKFYNTDNQGNPTTINNTMMSKYNGLVPMHYNGRIDDSLHDTLSDYSDIPDNTGNGGFKAYKIVPSNVTGHVVANPLGPHHDVNNYSSSIEWNRHAPTVYYKHVGNLPKRMYYEKVMYQFYNQNGAPVGDEQALNNGYKFTYGNGTTVNLSDLTAPSGYKINKNGYYRFGESSQKSGNINIDSSNVTPDKLAGATNVIYVPVIGYKVDKKLNVHVKLEYGQNHNITKLYTTQIDFKNLNPNHSDYRVGDVVNYDGNDVAHPTGFNLINTESYQAEFIHRGNSDTVDYIPSGKEPTFIFQAQPANGTKVEYLNQNNQDVGSDSITGTNYGDVINLSDYGTNHTNFFNSNHNSILAKGYSIEPGQENQITINATNQVIPIYVLGNKVIKDIKFIDETNDNQPLNSDEYDLNGTNSIGDTVSDIKIPNGYTVDTSQLPDGYSDTDNNLKYTFKSNDITNQTKNIDGTNQQVMSDNPIKLISNNAIQPIEYEDSDGNIIKRNNSDVYSDIYSQIGKIVTINQLPDDLKRQGYNIDSTSPINLTLKNTNIASEVRPKVDMMTPCIIHLSRNQHYGAHLKVVYLNQNGQQVGYTDVISGNVGQHIDVTKPNESGEAVPNGYTLLSSKLYTLPNTNNDNLPMVYLHVKGQQVNSDKVTINRILESNGQITSSPITVSNISGINGNDITLNANDYTNANGLSDYVPDDKYETKQTIQISKDSPDLGTVDFYYRSTQQPGAGITIRYINQHGQVVGISPMINGIVSDNKFTGTINGVDYHNASDGQVVTNNIPLGYKLNDPVAKNHNLDFENSPEYLDVNVTGKTVNTNFTVHRVISDLQSGNYISDATLKLHGNVGDKIAITPYSSYIYNNNTTPHTLTSDSQYHSVAGNQSLYVTLGADGLVKPIDSITYLYQKNYQNNVGEIRIHYTTDSSVANVNKDSNGELTDGSEIDMESDRNVNGQPFDITPYTKDIPIKSDNYSFNRIIGTAPSQFNTSIQDVYIQVNDDHDSYLLPNN